MIQELHLGASGSNSLLGDPKISFHGSPPHLHQHSSPSLTSSTATNNTTTNTPNSLSSTSENQNNNNNNSNNNSLRCPRCDSANTKFCYYNNYNLTQPRHFCKTCRRYWTKGGALRNIPIGGGCRKNKNNSNILASSKSSSGKFLKAIPQEIIGRAPSGFDHELPPNPILWGSSDNTSHHHHHHHLLALLRSATAQNPNPNPTHAKKEGAMMSSTEPLVSTDHLGHHQLLPSLGLCTNSMWRSRNQPPQQNGAVLSGHDLGMQELYQRLVRSSATTNYYLSDHSPVMLSNAASSSSSMLDQSAPVVGGELGYGSWNAAFSWSDLSTTNGAYP